MVSREDRIYYEQEMKRLVDGGRVFAERFPDIARYLNLHGTDPGSRDPHAERIVEGFAFLTGKIQRYLDAQFPELTHALLELIYPHYLRPLPSKALVQFTPQESMLDKPCAIPAGTELYADGLGPGGERYTFTTCAETLVQPIDLKKVWVDPEAPGDYSMSLNLALHGGADAGSCDWDQLTFAIQGDPSSCYEIYLQLAQRLSGISIKDLKGPPLSLAWRGFEPIPVEGSEGDRYGGFHYPRDYFDYPQRFFFFSIQGLNSWLKHETDLAGVQINFRFSKPFATGIHVRTENLGIHCAVVQNLFQLDCEPIVTDEISLEYPIRPHAERGDLEILNITSVVASKGRDMDVVEPYFRFRQEEREKLWFYTLRRDQSMEKGWDCFLRLLDLNHSGPGALNGKTISISAYCTNRDYAQKLKPGQLNRISTTVPETISVINLTQATPACWPPLHGTEEWDFLALLALDYMELGQLDAIKALLGLYHFSKSDGGARKIKGIERAGMFKDYEIYRGCCVQGQRLELDLNGAFYAGQGDVALFARIFAGFLDAWCPINGFIRLVVKELESGEVFRFTARGHT